MASVCRGVNLILFYLGHTNPLQIKL